MNRFFGIIMFMGSIGWMILAISAFFVKDFKPDMTIVGIAFCFLSFHLFTRSMQLDGDN